MSLMGDSSQSRGAEVADPGDNREKSGRVNFKVHAFFLGTSASPS